MQNFVKRIDHLRDQCQFFETPMRLTVQFTWLLFGLNVMVNHT